MFKRALLAGAAVAAALSFAPAAQAGQKIGLLTCQSDGSLGLLVTSKKDYLCVFTPASSRYPSEPYVGRLRTVGVDVGITGRQDFSWAVYAPSFRSGEPMSLDGAYYGASVDAAIASGGGAKVLVGGPNNGFTLQPIGLQAQFGLNATAGVSRFELAAADTGKAVYKN
ncbi:DUF992 domain-containing protein [Aureimonas leprariae]|uniref:DUF992 domain-containing protein n=1 Tax=Plantimonas leprariae TaxID=2615207 RepID=A0A7V7PPQ7_9HYPH|nr:DUF992 domain-containing protein [Aureimonas leprariae]KAB0680011.1 DUF992 domain-containing protein [Aureimonas leprariae]